MNDWIVLRRESEVCIVRFCLLSSLEDSYLINDLMYESTYPNEWSKSLEAENVETIHLVVVSVLPLYYLYSVDKYLLNKWEHGVYLYF